MDTHLLYTPTMDAERYDLLGERERYAFPDVERGGVSLNRGTAQPAAASTDPEGFADVRDRHRAALVTTTLPEDAPVIELDRPTAGIYVDLRRGVYLDLYQGVAQRLFDDARLRPRMQPLLDSGLLLRREINTDDFVGYAPAGVRLPQELAELVAGEAQRAFPREGGYRVFFSNSGAEAVEAAIKAATLSAYQRFLVTHGAETWASVCRELGIDQDPFLTDHARPVWGDYPLFVIALERAFHGRTLGSLALTRSRPAQREGFPLWRWARHVDPNDPAAVDGLIEPRPLADLLDEQGALAAVVGAGRVPSELLAAVVFEPFQGEGGYRPPNSETLRRLRARCDRAGALFVADEVQTFARAGATFFSEARALRPDVICLAKAAVLGMAILPADVAQEFPSGWHSNTFGSGKLFDVNLSHATFDMFLHGREPLFEGLSFAENERAKGAYFAEQLEALCRRQPARLSDPEGAGSLWGLTVADRPAFVAEAWRQGAKLLGAGSDERPGRVRFIFPADVLTKEIDDTVAVLERTSVVLGARP